MDGLADRDAWRSAFDAAVEAMRQHMLVDWKTDGRTGQVMSYVTPLHGTFKVGWVQVELV